MKLQSSLVLIEVDKPEERDSNGIYVQEEWKSLPPTGTVLQVGSGVTFCKKGDRVFFNRYTAVEYDGDLRLCREESILVVL